MTILTSDEDDFLYEKLLELLNQIKLVQGGSSLPATLRRHRQIKLYLIEKQIKKIEHIEKKYFTDDGLDTTAIESYHYKRSLQSN